MSVKKKTASKAVKKVKSKKEKKLTKKQQEKLDFKIAQARFTKTVRERDGGKCVLCGSKNKLSVHHWYIGKLACAGLEHNPDNGVLLCSYHHLIVAHKQGCFHVHNEIRKAVVKAIGNVRYGELQQKANTVCQKKERK